MFKGIVAATVMLGLGVAGIELASAETPASQGDSAGAKTSDRTPGNSAPDRTEGASTSGAAGTDAAQTSQGTSDRTPTQPAATAANPAVRGNLFTEEQARTHLARAGYVNISGLTKDENGAWRGAAMKDGKTIMVGIDVKGNVAAN